MGFFSSIRDEVARMEPLAHQVPLHIHKTDKHGVDVVSSDLGYQVLETQFHVPFFLIVKPLLDGEFFPAMASHIMLWSGTFKDWFFDTAAINGHRATGLELATRRWIGWRWDFTF